MKNTGIVRISNRTFNGASATGDKNPGGASDAPAGNPNAYIGQLGAVVIENNAAAAGHSDSADNTLMGGRYQYVQFKDDGTTYAKGQLLYWSDATNFIVTNVAPITTSAAFAGFCLSAVTKGYYWFMQTHGVVWALYKASPTSTTDQTAVYAVVNTNTVDALTDATADATAGVAKLFIGTAFEAPASAVTKRVYVKNMPMIE